MYVHFEDDLFEYSLRAKNVNTENDALLIITSNKYQKMDIIERFLRTGKIDPGRQKRWFHLYDKI